ncbi:MAG: hypothetical protein U0U66_09220 [Cytophagaceae bacterium]
MSSKLSNHWMPIFQSLKSDVAPIFGKMSAQHMIEHLVYTVMISNGKIAIEVKLPDAKVSYLKNYIVESENQFPQGFKSPILGDDLLPLRSANIEVACQKLALELEKFEEYFQQNPNATLLNPVAGALNYQEWVTFHDKHFMHHAKQFGLI